MPVVNGIEYPREVGLPDGMDDIAERWYGRETVYQSGTLKDEPYTRWYSKDGRHKSAISPKKMMQLDADDMNYDFDKRFAEWKAFVKERKDKEAQLREEAKEARGRISGARKDTCIALFEAKYGNLSGAMVQAFPGWETRWTYSSSSGQTAVRYIEPDGETWFLLKDLMACLGAKIETGVDISEMMRTALANQNPELFVLGRRRAESAGNGEYVYRQDGAAPPPSVEDKRMQKKAKKLERLLSLDGDDIKRRRVEVEDAPAVVATETDFVERPSLRLVRLYREDTDFEAATARLKVASAPTPAATAIFGAELLAQLLTRGFESDTEVVALFDQEGENDHPLLATLAGFYFSRGVDVSGRLFYQKMLEGPQDRGAASPAVLCQGLYICWSESRRRWKVASSLDDGKAGFASCAADCPSPADASSPWSLLRADFPGLQKTGS